MLFIILFLYEKWDIKKEKQKSRTEPRRGTGKGHMSGTSFMGNHGKRFPSRRWDFFPEKRFHLIEKHGYGFFFPELMPKLSHFSLRWTKI
jgi:hypothetical protein